MAQKQRSAFADYLAYLVVRIFVCFVQALSFDNSCTFARFLAWMVYHLDKRHRVVASENLQKSFPGKFTEAETDVLVRRVYAHFCRMLIEFIHLPRRCRLHNYKRYVVMEEPKRMVDLFLSGRPVLFVTGHFGNWEAAGYAFAMVGFRLHAIARPLDNPYIDDFFRSYRERTGQKLLAKQGDFDQIEKILADGGLLATLADQDAGSRGVFVDFFGRPASTHKAVALMALEHNVPMVVTGTPLWDGQHHLTVADIIFPEDYAKSPDAVREITQRFTAGLESLIRKSPEQYFWLHRRWKHAPPVRKKKLQAA